MGEDQIKFNVLPKDLKKKKNGSGTGVGVILNESGMRVGVILTGAGWDRNFFSLWPVIGMGQYFFLWEWDETGVKIHSSVTL